MVQEELNYFYLLEFMMKVRASLTVLIGDDQEKMDKIQNLYLHQASISLSTDKPIYTKSKFLEFLERDEREAMHLLLTANIQKKLNSRLSRSFTLGKASNIRD